jgi:hypothetical protein
MLVGIRSMPIGSDIPAAIERIKTIKVQPLKRTLPAAGHQKALFVDTGQRPYIQVLEVAVSNYKPTCRYRSMPR